MLLDIEDGEEGDEVKIEDDIDEEVEPVKVATDPGKPTERQIEEHRATHLPFRSWCRWCVLGRGRGLQHRARIGSVIPIIGLDYFFLTSAGIVMKKELKLDDAQVNEARTRATSRNALWCAASRRRPYSAT